MVVSLAGFVVSTGLLILVPGPDTLVVLRSLLRDGRGQAVRAVAGVLTGLSVWLAVTAVGLSALLRASEQAYLVLRVVGGLYLCVLGVQALRSRGATAEVTDAAHRPRRGGLLGTGYTAGLASDLFNPKVGVFCVTFLPAFVPAGEPVGPVLAVLSVLFVVETAAYFALLLAAADRVVAALRRPRLRQRLDRLTGVILIGFGVRLAIEP